MSYVTTHTSGTRATPSASNIGLCKFNTTTKAFEVSDGDDWLVYNYDSVGIPFTTNTYSLDFDGVDDYMETSVPVVTGTEAITLSGWVYLTATPAAYDTFIAIRGSTATGTGRFLGLYDTTRKLSFGTYGPGVTGTTALSLNTWYHIAATCSAAGAAKVYLNGVLEASGSVTYNSVASGNTFTVARGGGTEYAQAKIDEVAVWNEVLGDGGVNVGTTASGEIASLYNSGFPGNIMSLGTSGPEGWWRMGDSDLGQGTTITDVGNGGNHGTMVNGSSGNTTPNYSTDIP